MAVSRQHSAIRYKESLDESDGSLTDRRLLTAEG